MSKPGGIAPQGVWNDGMLLKEVVKVVIAIFAVIAVSQTIPFIINHYQLTINH
ncbi:MAG: hypothetical protein JW973_04770 [Bacteroidales bacterium]|nr:hypothetical protein [Bacteroidales bacterium]